MGDMGCIPFVLFAFSFPGFHIMYYVVPVFGWYQHAADDVLCVDSQVGIQHFVQLLGKVDGNHNEAKGNDVLYRQEQAAR